MSPAAVLFAPDFTAETRVVFLSRPYLAAINPPDLRFTEALPPPDLSVRPPAGAPPSPAAVAEPVAAPALPPAASRPALAAESGPTPVAPAGPTTGPAAVPATATPPILPDDTRAKVRPEDFLPFFQFPAHATQADGVTVVAPATLTPPTPGTQPPSSATYRQQ